MKKLIALFIIPAFLIACSEDKKPSDPKVNAESSGNSPGRGRTDAKFLSIRNENGQALAGAQVLIGESLNAPFEGNFLTADENGRVAIPNSWTAATSVTVNAPGFVRVTYFQQLPKAVTFKLRKINQQPKIELSGTTSGHNLKNYDDILDVGLVLSGLTRNDMLAFDINKVISNQTDKLSVAGQSADIPSNIAIPKQWESYVIPLSIEKPKYRLYFEEKGVQRVFAARVTLPFAKLIDGVRDEKKFFELINLFTITSGVVRDVNLSADKNTLNLPVNEMTFSQKKKFKAPAVRSDEILMGLAASDMNGWLVPTDVKRFTNGQTLSLATLPGQTSLAVGVLKKAAEFEGDKPGMDRLSAVVLPFTDGLSPKFLNLIPDPSLSNSRDLRMTRPTALQGVNELATHALLSEVKEIPQGDDKTTFLVRRWEAYAPQWVENMAIPEWPQDEAISGKKRWEVTFIGSQLIEQADLGQAVIDAATHVSHSSIDF